MKSPNHSASRARIVNAVISVPLFVFAVWHSAFLVRFLSAPAFPYGRLVAITEDSSLSDVALIRLGLGLLFGVIVVFVFNIRLSNVRKYSLIACLLVAPVLIAMLFGLNCDRQFDCLGNKRLSDLHFLFTFGALYVTLMLYLMLRKWKRT